MVTMEGLLIITSDDTNDFDDFDFDDFDDFDDILLKVSLV